LWTLLPTFGELKVRDACVRRSMHGDNTISDARVHVVSKWRAAWHISR